MDAVGSLFGKRFGMEAAKSLKSIRRRGKAFEK